MPSTKIKKLFYTSILQLQQYSLNLHTRNVFKKTLELKKQITTIIEILSFHIIYITKIQTKTDKKRHTTS